VTALAGYLLIAGLPGWAHEDQFAGIISAGAPFRLDQQVTTGGATLFTGSAIDSMDSTVRVRLRSGANVDIAPNSRARVFADRAKVESGSIAIGSAAPFDIDARSLRIRLQGARAAGQISVLGDTVQVSVLGGEATVTKSPGFLIARVLPQHALAFNDGPNKSPASTIVTGQLQENHGQFRIQDETSRIEVDLTGRDLTSYSGKRVRLVGTLARNGAGDDPQTLMVSHLALASAQPLMQEAGAALAAGALNITIEEGEGAVNNIKGRVAREVIVKVEDENHKPVAGAAVSMLLPRSGPSGQFAGGGQTFSGTTDASGRVMAKFTPNKQSGQVQIQVDAKEGERKASRTFLEMNSILDAAAGATAGGGAAGAAVGGASGISNGTMALVVGVTVAAIVAPIAIVASHNTTATISPE